MHYYDIYDDSIQFLFKIVKQGFLISQLIELFRQILFKEIDCFPE